MEEFIKVSQQIGKNILYVQGAGGNTSIKIGNKLYIKASGEKLKNMTEKKGYVCCKYKQLADFFPEKQQYTVQDELRFLELVNTSIITTESFGLPSMEVGFHAVLSSKYVFHLHSMYANIFTCMRYGSSFIKKILTDIPFIVIDYKNPGYELAFDLSKRTSLPSLILLKNHGIIVHGQKIETCLQLLEKLHKLIEAFLKENNAYFPFSQTTVYKKLNTYIIPDSAVFSHIKIDTLPIRKKKELLEIASMQDYTIKIIKKLGRTPMFLTDQEVHKLLAMKQEKYRQELFKK